MVVMSALVLTALGKLRLLFVAEGSQMPDECHELPDLVFVVRWREGRHSRHADAVRHDPEELSIAPLLDSVGRQLWRGRVEALGEFGPRKPWRGVAIETV